jgi:hypothetical protein
MDGSFTFKLIPDIKLFLNDNRTLKYLLPNLGAFKNLKDFYDYQGL